MKIGSPSDKPAPTAVTTHGTPATGHHAGTAAAGAIPTQADASAKIELSSAASTLLSSGSTAEFDAEKVARISAAIESGTFQINPQAIADKLISNAQELLSKVRS